MCIILNSFQYLYEDVPFSTFNVCSPCIVLCHQISFHLILHYVLLTFLCCFHLSLYHPFKVYQLRVLFGLVPVFSLLSVILRGHTPFSLKIQNLFRLPFIFFFQIVFLQFPISKSCINLLLALWSPYSVCALHYAASNATYTTSFLPSLLAWRPTHL